MSLKSQIMLYRAKFGLSQRAFAAKAGISETTLRKIETGTSSTNKITRLTRAKIELAMAEDETKMEG